MHAQITADLSPYLKRTFRPCGTTTSPLPASRQFSMTEEGAYVDLDGDVELEGQLGEDQMDVSSGDGYARGAIEWCKRPEHLLRCWGLFCAVPTVSPHVAFTGAA